MRTLVNTFGVQGLIAGGWKHKSETWKVKEWTWKLKSKRESEIDESYIDIN